jgi:putative protease
VSEHAKGVQGVQGQVRAEPMTLSTGEDTCTLRIDCKPCEMHLVGAMKPDCVLAASRGSPGGFPFFLKM